MFCFLFSWSFSYFEFQPREEKCISYKLCFLRSGNALLILVFPSLVKSSAITFPEFQREKQTRLKKCTKTIRHNLILILSGKFVIWILLHQIRATLKRLNTIKPFSFLTDYVGFHNVQFYLKKIQLFFSTFYINSPVASFSVAFFCS